MEHKADLAPGALWTHKRRGITAIVAEIADDKVRITDANGLSSRWLKIRGFTRDYYFSTHTDGEIVGEGIRVTKVPHIADKWAVHLGGVRAGSIFQVTPGRFDAVGADERDLGSFASLDDAAFAIDYDS